MLCIQWGSTTSCKQLFNHLTVFVNHFQASEAVDSHCESLVCSCIGVSAISNIQGLALLPVILFHMCDILVEMLNGGPVLWM